MGFTLITGASGGIGAEFAKIYAKRGDNLILVARSKDKLDALKISLEGEFEVEILVKAFDLAIPENVTHLMAELNEIKINRLINNAGVGRLRAFADDSLEANTEMMNLNMNSLVTLTHHVLQKMKLEKSGEILNIASIAGFLPGPYMSVYFATKAFVLSFSQALTEELSDIGIKVSCLCPGPVSTNFFEEEGLKAAGKAHASPWVESANHVAQKGVKMLDENKALYVSGFMNWVLTISVRILPSSITRKLAKRVNR